MKWGAWSVECGELSVREATCKALYGKPSSWSVAIGSIRLGMDSIEASPLQNDREQKTPQKSVALGVEIRA